MKQNNTNTERRQKNDRKDFKGSWFMLINYKIMNMNESCKCKFPPYPELWQHILKIYCIYYTYNFQKCPL